MDRSRRAHNGKVRKNTSRRGHRLLGSKHESDTSKPLPTINVYHDSGRRNTGDRPTCATAEAGTKTNEHNCPRDGREDKENLGAGLRDPLDQKGGRYAPVHAGSARARRIALEQAYVKNHLKGIV